MSIAKGYPGGEATSEGLAVFGPQPTVPMGKRRPSEGTGLGQVHTQCDVAEPDPEPGFWTFGPGLRH